MSMKKMIGTALAASVLTVLPIMAAAHHSVAGEYGGSDRERNWLEGEIIEIKWVNPHVSMTLQVTDGDVETGKKWRINTHNPRLLSDNYGIEKTDYKVGDTVRVDGWTHLRDLPLFHIRAMSVNGASMRSFLGFADMRDIAAGNQGDIVPSPSLEGQSPRRLGEDMVKVLSEKGYLDANGNFTLKNK